MASLSAQPGAELRAERARRDLNQTQVADMIGVSRPVIVRAENGGSVQLDTALKLAAFYERPVEELFPVLDEAA